MRATLNQGVEGLTLGLWGGPLAGTEMKMAAVVCERPRDHASLPRRRTNEKGMMLYPGRGLEVNLPRIAAQLDGCNDEGVVWLDALRDGRRAAVGEWERRG